MQLGGLGIPWRTHFERQQEKQKATSLKRKRK